MFEKVSRRILRRKIGRNENNENAEDKAHKPAPVAIAFVPARPPQAPAEPPGHAASHALSRESDGTWWRQQLVEANIEHHDRFVRLLDNEADSADNIHLERFSGLWPADYIDIGATPDSLEQDGAGEDGSMLLLSPTPALKRLDNMEEREGDAVSVLVLGQRQ